MRQALRCHQKLYLEYSRNLLRTQSHTFGGLCAQWSINDNRYNFIQIVIALVSDIDEYIRAKLFDRYFDPFEDNNLRILFVLKGDIIAHIIKEFSIAIHNMQMDVDVSEAVVEKQWFSSIDTMMGREDFALNIVKSIYEKVFYPQIKVV